MLNRGALILRPKQPFLDWVMTLEDKPEGLVPDGDETVYLVPVYENEEQAVAILAQAWQLVFEEELFNWHTEEKAWPQNRTVEMFLEWFDVEFHSVIRDLCEEPLQDDEVSES